MNIIVRQYTGRTTVWNIDPTDVISDSVVKNWNSSTIDILDYAKAVQLMNGRYILNWSKKWSDYSITEGATVTEVLKGWTMGETFNQSTLSGICALTGKKIERPYIINPGCCHLFDESALTEWRSENVGSCPLCDKRS